MNENVLQLAVSSFNLAEIDLRQIDARSVTVANLPTPLSLSVTHTALQPVLRAYLSLTLFSPQSRRLHDEV